MRGTQGEPRDAQAAVALMRNLGGFTGAGHLGDVVDEVMPSPVEVVEQRELLDAVGQALAGLPLAQRAALELKSMGYSLAEIGEAIEVSESNAGVLVHRARRAVANYLKASYREESA